MIPDEYRKQLKQRLIESAAKILYTYTAHWKIVDRLKNRHCIIKIIQIILTGVASCSLLSILFNNCTFLPLIGGIFAFFSLAINLYSLNFNLPDQIKQHTEAANELWSIRESYIALITDFDILTNEDIRSQRDKLKEMVSQINKNYPSTDKDSYKKAQIALKQNEEQTFKEGEAENLLNLHNENLSKK